MGSEENSTAKMSFTDIVKKVSGAGTMAIEFDQKKVFGWFLFVVVGLLGSFWLFFARIVHNKHALLYSLGFIAIAAVVPFFLIFISKWLATKTHKIKLLNKGNFRNPEEEALYNLVESICKRAGLTTMPAVGIYESPDLNAFATGRSKEDSLVAVSTGLLEKMDERAVSAVVAHEVAHIANGDMLTLALIQSAVVIAVMIVALPVWILNLVVKFSTNESLFIRIANAITWLVTFALASFGILLVRYYSREREYGADALSADLVDRNYMIEALKFLQNDRTEIPKQQMLFTAFKINAPPFLMELLSSHPPIEKRIQALIDRA